MDKEMSPEERLFRVIQGDFVSENKSKEKKEATELLKEGGDNEKNTSDKQKPISSDEKTFSLNIDSDTDNKDTVSQDPPNKFKLSTPSAAIPRKLPKGLSGNSGVSIPKPSNSDESKHKPASEVSEPLSEFENSSQVANLLRNESEPAKEDEGSLATADTSSVLDSQEIPTNFSSPNKEEGVVQSVPVSPKGAWEKFNEVVLSRVSFILGIKQNKGKSMFAIVWRRLSHKSINGILLVVLVVLIGTVVRYAITKKPDVALMMSAISRIKFEDDGESEMESLKSLDFYLAQFQKRNMFNTIPKKVEQVTEVVTQEISLEPPPRPKKEIDLEEFEKKILDLVIVGISWGKHPKIMIKSQADQKTYFLREGQKIGMTDIEIQTIHKTKVILIYEGLEKEL